MMTNAQLNVLFLRIAEELDIPDHLFEKAERSYQALGEYINNHCDCSVAVYTQGSFRLGTVIRPLSDEDEYDLDLVTEVTGVPLISPKDLKHKIGDILRESKRYSSMLEEKKRCWRIAPFIIDDYSRLEESLGETVVERAISEADPIKHDFDLPTTEYNNPKIKTALSVPHRQKPPFKLPKYAMLGIRATITENGVSRPYQNNGPAIPKNCSIDFGLVVSPKLLKGGYTVKWQVVNTGDEARAANGLRGGFETEVNSPKRHESTQYQGTHFIQAFLLKRGKCIAMSREFIVNIK